MIEQAGQQDDRFGGQAAMLGGAALGLLGGRGGLSGRPDRPIGQLLNLSFVETLAGNGQIQGPAQTSDLTDTCGQLLGVVRGNGCIGLRGRLQLSILFEGGGDVIGQRLGRRRVRQ